MGYDDPHGRVQLALFATFCFGLLVGYRAKRFTVITRSGHGAWPWGAHTSAAHTSPLPNITPWSF